MDAEHLLTSSLFDAASATRLGEELLARHTSRRILRIQAQRGHIYNDAATPDVWNNIRQNEEDLIPTWTPEVDGAPARLDATTDTLFIQIPIVCGNRRTNLFNNEATNLSLERPNPLPLVAQMSEDTLATPTVVEEMKKAETTTKMPATTKMPVMGRRAPITDPPLEWAPPVTSTTWRPIEYSDNTAEAETDRKLEAADQAVYNHPAFQGTGGTLAALFAIFCCYIAYKCIKKR